MEQSVILSIHGRVQGVGFRYFVKSKADELEISGFVKNQLNGIVHVEAEGDPEKLQLFVHICKQGPSHARIEKVDIQNCPLQGFEGFHIR